LAHADPAAELPAVAVALDATVVARSSRGIRRIPASEFFKFHFTSALEVDELLTEIEVPAGSGRRGSCFLEVAARHGDYALAGAAVVIELGDDGRVSDSRVVCISVGPGPVRLTEAEAVLHDAIDIDDALAVDMQKVVADRLQPHGDLRASPDYKRRVTGVLIRDAARAALASARERVDA
jgi:carbon-monoxide dehydrogenase medium subunit